LTATPGQTVGPFFGYALPFERGSELVPPGAPGAIQLHGTVTDGLGHPVPDALLEIWQADADGNVPDGSGALRRDGWTFSGWGRAATDDEGHYGFTTVLPGSTDSYAAQFISVVIFARGLLNRLFTRIYLPGADDALLSSLPADRRSTLIAAREDRGLRFDVNLQGPNETVFLTYPGHRP
jgi:protocatechuate 3,4-dioxygenase, alpha subunit